MQIMGNQSTPIINVNSVNTNTNTNTNVNNNTKTSTCNECNYLTADYAQKICGRSSFLWCLSLTLLTGGLILCIGCDEFDRCKDTEILCGNCQRRKGLYEHPCCWMICIKKADTLY